MMKPDSQLALLDRLVGRWATEATHPMMPGVVVHGTTTFEWLEGRKFLILRSHTDHPDFPDGLCVIGDMAHDRTEGSKHEVSSDGASKLQMHYFDDRGVFRLCETRISEESWEVWRDAPGFSQRFKGRLSAGGDVIDGLWELRRDDVHWADDLKITYRRQK